jgi:nicotinamide/nicotinate riboside kinase
VDVDPEVLETAKEGFKRIEEEQRTKGFELVWFLVDGFVLYWDQVCFSMSSIS